MVEAGLPVQGCTPPVGVGAPALAQRHRDDREVGELALHLFGEGLVDVHVQLAAGHIDVGLDPQALLDILFVGDDDVGILHHLPHHLRGALAPLPELLAVVEVHRDGGSGLLCALHGSHGAVGGVLADRRGDAGDVQPGGIRHDGIEVEVLGLCQRDGGGLTVVDDVARPLVGAGLKVVDSHPSAARHLDGGGIDPPLAHFADRSLPDVVVRKGGDELGILSEQAEGDGDVRLSTTKGGFQERGLEEALVSGALQTQHDLTECDKFLTHMTSMIYSYEWYDSLLLFTIIESMLGSVNTILKPCFNNQEIQRRTRCTKTFFHNSAPLALYRS